MSDTKTDPRPMTPAESRALDALVEWRRAQVNYRAMLAAGQLGRVIELAASNVAWFEDAMRDAADAVVKEREVRRG